MATVNTQRKGARRGRKQDDSLPPSRSRDVQRAFRARKAEQMAELAARVKELEDENDVLRARLGDPPRPRPEPAVPARGPVSRRKNSADAEADESEGEMSGGAAGWPRSRSSSDSNGVDAPATAGNDDGAAPFQPYDDRWISQESASPYSPSNPHLMDPHVTLQLVSQVQAHAQAQAQAQLQHNATSFNSPSMPSTSHTLGARSDPLSPDPSQSTQSPVDAFSSQFPNHLFANSFPATSPAFWGGMISRPPPGLDMMGQADHRIAHHFAMQAATAAGMYLQPSSHSLPHLMGLPFAGLVPTGPTPSPSPSFFTPARPTPRLPTPTPEDENNFLSSCCGVAASDLPPLPTNSNSNRNARRQRLKPYPEFCLLLMRHLLASSPHFRDDATSPPSDECCGGLMSCSGPDSLDDATLPVGYIRAALAFQRLVGLMDKAKLQVDDLVTVLQSDQGGLRLNDIGAGHWVLCEKAFGLVVREEVVFGAVRVIEEMMKSAYGPRASGSGQRVPERPASY